MSNSTIHVEGLRELQRALKRIDTQFPKDLKGRLKVIAEHVASIVRGVLPRLKGLMISKTKAHATNKGAGIAWRGVPYAGPTEFGGYPGDREYIQKGRYIYPTVEAERSWVEEQVQDVLDDIIRSAGLN